LIHHVGFSHVLNPYFLKNSHRNSLIKIFSKAPADTKIIFQIRRQDKVTQSFFQKNAPSFISKPIDIFLDFPSKNVGSGGFKLNNKVGMFLIDSFNYFSPIEIAATFFGKNNVHILTLEELEAEPEKYFKKLSDIFNEDLSCLIHDHKSRVNTSDVYRRRYPSWMRLRPSFFTKALQPLKRLIPKKRVILSDKERDIILEHFADSNRRISEEFNLDLDRFGYF
jgi:hypothetical protein